MTILERDLEAVLAVVAGRAEAQAERRQLDDEVVAAIASSGLNRSLLPAALGGSERHPGEVVEVVAQIAAVDGSTGWCSAIGAGSNVFAGYMDEGAARTSFDDPDAGGASVFAPMGVVQVAGDGKATLSGRWAFASNSVHGQWTGLGAFVVGADGVRDPIPRLVFVPGKDLTIEDTWHGSGLRATGSHHVRLDAAPVDLDRSCTFADRAWPEGPLWRMPLFTILAPVLAAAPLGIARGAIDDLQRQVIAGDAGASRGRLHDDPVGLAELAAADSALRAAHAGLLDVVDRVWQEAVAGRRASGALQARTILAVGHASDIAVDATAVAHRLYGGASAYVGHRGLTALRDVETARQHALFGHSHRPTLMRISAGSSEIAPPLVI